MKHQPVAMPEAVLWFLLSYAITFHLGVVLPAAAAAISNMSASALSTAPPPDCPSRCGYISIPYPFGIGDGCAWPGSGSGFNVTCDHSFSPPKPFLGGDVFEILSITVQTGEVRVVSPVSYICSDSYNTTNPDRADWSLELTSSLRISKTRNNFTAIGCYTVAFLGGVEDQSYLTGCISSCESINQAAQDNDACAGLGCCQMPIAGNRRTIQVHWGDTNGSVNPAWKYSPCSYGFVAETGRYHFKREHLKGKKSFVNSKDGSTLPLVFDWAINGSCIDSDTPACPSNHSDCIAAEQWDGYRCNCSKEYNGNPYVIGFGGCTDIDECDPKERYPCGKNTKCRNTDGSYVCDCKNSWLYRRDGSDKDDGCRLIVRGSTIAIVATFVAIVLLGVILWLVLTEHKRRRRKGFFDKNGGKVLKGVGGINIYSEEQLAKITNRYSKSIGKGHFGHVYMGNTEDNQRVAVKHAIVKDSKKSQVGGDFVHELTIQFQMKHDNLVRLVGCCLETEVPMLVFEFVANGSLFNVLHGDSGNRRALSLQERLNIAIGSAEALAYMHSPASDHKRIHGDVKSANILLDDNLLPKVSDFGSSKVISASSRYVRLVASDMNYVDPIYMKTHRFTEKSDVYSFGVVLLEIITRKPAKYDDENNSLPIKFVKCCKVEGNGRKMYDRDMLTDDETKTRAYMECLDRVSELAVRCVREDDDERPTMLEVVQELEQVRRML